MSGLSSWARRLSRLWFLARSFPLRARFMTGKASFVEADVRMTTNSLADVAGAGEAPRTRLLAHYQLETRRPRAGLQGWKLYDERVGGETPHRVAALVCGFCGHRYIVQVLASADPLASDLTGGRGPGAPASYSSDWFRFVDESFEGPTDLGCLHCEQNGPAEAEFLR